MTDDEKLRAIAKIATGGEDIPRIYDPTTDRMRFVTQADVDELVAFRNKMREAFCKPDYLKVVVPKAFSV